MERSAFRKQRFGAAITEHRNPGSPAWLPRFRDGSFVRFMNQNGDTGPADAPWGPMRIVYLQYASDPITFFDYRDFYRRPAWMDAPRGPDVSPELRWYPVVSMLQLALDMAVATTTPMGYGHVFAPEHYVDAWLAVTDPQGWSADQIGATEATSCCSRQDVIATARVPSCELFAGSPGHQQRDWKLTMDAANSPGTAGRAGSRATSPSDAAQVDDTAIARPQRNFKVSAGTACPIDEKAPAAIHTADVPKTTVAQQPLAVPACDRPVVVEAGADIDLDRDGMGGRRQSHRCHQTENET